MSDSILRVVLTGVSVLCIALAISLGIEAHDAKVAKQSLADTQTKLAQSVAEGQAQNAAIEAAANAATTAARSREASITKAKTVAARATAARNKLSSKLDTCDAAAANARVAIGAFLATNPSEDDK